ncbi:unnamed protein product [Cercospora beticola]|nr:unnamed protein product [Cercospora beticola]
MKPRRMVADAEQEACYFESEVDSGYPQPFPIQPSAVESGNDTKSSSVEIAGLEIDASEDFYTRKRHAPRRQCTTWWETQGWSSSIKTGRYLCLLLSPCSAVLINLYASSKGTQRELTSLPSRYLQSIPQMPTWIAEPGPDLFVASSLSLCMLMITHRSLHSHHDHHRWLVAGCLGLALLLGLIMRMSTIAMLLYMLPWGICLGLFLAELIMVRLVDLPESVQAESAHEAKFIKNLES